MGIRAQSQASIALQVTHWFTHHLAGQTRISWLVEALLVAITAVVTLYTLTTIQSREATIADQAGRLQMLVDSDTPGQANRMAALERAIAEVEGHLQVQRQVIMQAHIGGTRAEALAQADEQMLLSRLEGLLRQQLQAQRRVVARAAAEQDTETYGLAAAWEAKLQHRLQQLQTQRQRVPGRRVSQ